MIRADSVSIRVNFISDWQFGQRGCCMWGMRGGDGNSLKVEFHLCVSNIAHSDKRSGTPFLTKFGENTSKRHQTVAARNIEVLRRAVPMPPDGIGRARPLTVGNKKSVMEGTFIG